MNRSRQLSGWVTGVLSSLCWLTGLAQSIPPDSVRHRVILIGDAGRLRGGKNPVVDAVESRYSFTDPRTTLLYLGDNVYPYGLSDETNPRYNAFVETLRYQARPSLARPALEGSGLSKQSSANPAPSSGREATPPSSRPGRVLFIPGNHDWAQGRPDGWDNIRRQGRWLESLNAPNIRLLPADGCPGPEEILLSDKLVLVILDSQWWLHPHDKPGLESDCAGKTEVDVVARLVDIANRHKDKGVIVATHHPFRSYGIHGGYYTLKQHLFPLTDSKPNLYLPLPLIGSIYPVVRGVFGSIQDLPHPTYRHLIRTVEKALAPVKNIVFVSGHEHTLQHIIDRGRHYIVSGSGINHERVKKGKLARFVSPQMGYVVLDELTDGKLVANFHTVDDAANATQVYSDTLFILPPVPVSGQTGQRPAWPDSVRFAIAPAYDSVGRVHRWLLGRNYRTEWATPVTLPVFDLTRTNGGFTILQRGGGQQTQSLRLEDSTGREWVLRSVQKDPGNALPAQLRETIAKHVLQDEISAAHPFASLVVPQLAQAAGVPHASPTLVYLPDDPALGIYQAEFGKAAYLLEERSPGSGKSISTAKLLDALTDDNDNHVDQRAVLRARMLDLLMGDWDRHEDQWRWGSRKTETGKEYFPIPRDRDQVFFRAGGLLPSIAALPWLQPKFQGFGPKLANVNGSMYNARHVDRLFLPGLDARDWQHEITELQTRMTDSVLQAAINQLPDTIRRLSGGRLLETLKIRRNWLQKEGLTYYRFLAKTVDIPGSDKTELFRIDYQDDNEVAVSVYKIAKDGLVKQRLYSRVFWASETKEIRLYGQQGADQFAVSGSGSGRIKVRLIGGKGGDAFTVAGSPGKPIIYDRSTEANELPPAGRAILRTSTDPAVNQYDPHVFKYDRLAPLLTGGYNLDDGVLLGAGVQWTKQGFRKTPYAAMNRLLVRRALATNATSIKYDGMFTDLIGKNDLWINAFLRAPDNVTNFFGPGNETIYEKDRGIRYYRTRYNLVNVAALLKRTLMEHVAVSVGPVFQQFTLDADENEGRFIERYVASQPDPSRFLRRESYAGVQAGILIDGRDNAPLPSRGIYWNTAGLQLWGFGSQRNQLTQIQSDLSIHTRPGRTSRLVITNRIGGGLTAGNPAFYQLLYLGGQDNLRGFRTYRFAGNHSVYHNLEARLKLFDFRSYLFPASVGLLAFNDVGRVWLRGERSNRWHQGYGGGLYVTPASLLVIMASVGFSDEGVLPYVSLGFKF